MPTPEPARPQVAKPMLPQLNARSLALWLRPQTLRTQFILTEIIQPPLALRPPDQRRP